jgi:uncharacterized protein (DUF2267 family)
VRCLGLRDGAGCARSGETMTALRLSLTLAALFFGSLGAALGLYAAAFIGVGNDIDPFMRSIHQQSEWTAWAAAAACIAAVFSATERLIKLERITIRVQGWIPRARPQ